MRGVAQLSLSELRLLTRDPAALFFMVAFPLMLLVINGGDGGKSGEDGRAEALVPGYIVMILAIGGIAALPEVLAVYRERKVLRRLKATPISPLAVLIGQVAAQLAMALAGAAVIVGVGALGFGLDRPANPAWPVAAFLLCALMVYSVGFLIAAVAPGGHAASLLGLMVLFPMIFLCGAVIPREDLHANVLRIGRHLPLAHGVDALHDSWSGTPSATSLLIMAAVIVVCTATAAVLFRWE
ncbi:ABC transporter permease [Embleya sp. NPDC050154]|uniref:ABC transporter permease n=1 Tax=Embleya sp. NPDC050154 TaxID=3363988 RepID=UPI0037912CA9